MGSGRLEREDVGCGVCVWLKCMDAVARGRKRGRREGPGAVPHTANSLQHAGSINRRTSLSLSRGSQLLGESPHTLQQDSPRAPLTGALLPVLHHPSFSLPCSSNGDVLLFPFRSFSKLQASLYTAMRCVVLCVHAAVQTAGVHNPVGGEGFADAGLHCCNCAGLPICVVSGIACRVRM